MRQSKNGGMPLHEAMACKIPSLAPDYSALSEWPKGGVYHLPLDRTLHVQTPQYNTVHRYVDTVAAVEVLETLYHDKEQRDTLAQAGYELATDTKFHWSVIADQFYSIFERYI